MGNLLDILSFRRFY